ncbi:MAG: AAA family ATPase [Spirochaetales bacterium]|nr:AAA family ATPase [Spirochaetales bacterium]
MKIKSIYIDGLHNAKDKTYYFEDIAYIFGNNGAGKSTILQAIQFGLLGYIPGTAKNSREAFLRHSPTGVIQVKLSLTDPNGEDVLIQRKVTAKATTVEIIPEGYDITPIVEDLELPIFNFNEFVGQTANKLKEYFIKNILPTVDGNLDWKQILTESTLDCNFQDRDSIINYGLDLVHDIQGDVLEQVVAANSKFKEEQSFNKSELQRLQNTVDSLIYYDDYVGPTNMEEITSKLLALGSYRDQVIRYNSAIAAVQSAKDELDRLTAHINELGGNDGFTSCNDRLAKIRSEQEFLNIEIANKRDELTALNASDSITDSIINSKGICPYTKDTCKSIVDRIEVIRNESAACKAKKVELTDDMNKLNESLNEHRSEIHKLESIIGDFQTTWNRVEALKKTLDNLPEKPNTDKTVQELDIEIAKLSDSKTKLQANIQYNNTIENITKQKYETELQSKALANWIKKTDTNGLQTTLMLAPFDELAKTMTNYIVSMYGRDDLKAHFNVSTKANSFSFGLIRNGIYIPYDLLSSGEKCVYSLALMICIINECKSPLKVMLCDDMFDHLDNQAIENTFEALKLYNVIEERNNRNKIQFIFAGVKECKNAEDVMVKI